MNNESVTLKVTGYADVEMADHVLTIVAVGGSVVVSTIDDVGVKFYSYDPHVGWRLRAQHDTERNDSLLS